MNKSFRQKRTKKQVTRTEKRTKIQEPRTKKRTGKQITKSGKRTGALFCQLLFEIFTYYLLLLFAF